LGVEEEVVSRRIEELGKKEESRFKIWKVRTVMVVTWDRKEPDL
jgi:hypothetical protein